jgi:hypothetical protein
MYWQLNSTTNTYQDLLLLTTNKTDQGYTATFDIGIDPTAMREVLSQAQDFPISSE